MRMPFCAMGFDLVLISYGEYARVSGGFWVWVLMLGCSWVPVFGGVCTMGGV